MPSDLLQGVALVTGGGRGIGASIARELADAGMTVAVSARTAEQVESVAAEIDGLVLALPALLLYQSLRGHPSHRRAL